MFNIKIKGYSLNAFLGYWYDYFSRFLRRVLLLVKLRCESDERVYGYSNVLVVAPHPDDEIIGLGGYILKYIKNGGRLTIMYLTDGEKSLHDIDPGLIAKKRIEISECVAGSIGIQLTDLKRLHFLDGNIPDINDDSFSGAVSEVGKIVKGINPEVIFVPYYLDGHSDHVAAFEIMRRLISDEQMQCRLYGYWVWLWYTISMRNISNIDWAKTRIIRIGKEFNAKKELISLYFRDKADNGVSWCGDPPAQFLKPFNFKFEVVTEIDLKV
ncbi:MAG: PIG-L family deacetylase [Chlorobium sp.]|uniref:PIG-L deacetylase family protein n=1 Tax=Chlorobium sp. TaxID=1095 RepID=UPI0025C16169|nr:PIG-L family deacetylase [Chlorobium sp.]MCF8384018.1 PIG-L family deacetylase [Chlorobium sp.]